MSYPKIDAQKLKEVYVMPVEKGDKALTTFRLQLE